MEIYELSNIYYEEKFIKSISRYFHIPEENIKKSGDYVSTRSKLRQKYKEINNIKDYSRCDENEVGNILSMVKSMDEPSIQLGLDLFFTSMLPPCHNTYELLCFLKILSYHHMHSFFYFKFNTFLYLLDTGDKPEYRFIEYYKINTIVTDFRFAPQESVKI